jgi:A/G-specific adenine glycosylase
MKRSARSILAKLHLRSWVRRRLLAWFELHARDLPWRRRRDPFAIWVSEVMLQQTQAATVIPYFERFLQAFPDVYALAAADEQTVLRLWEGLGYYRRARALHVAARRLCDEHAGRIPNDPEVLAELPGFGRYTVNAVLSQAFEQRLPILEANSRRVLCRFLGVRADPGTVRVQEQLWRAAAQLLPTRRVGDFNQALMELGALVCTTAVPACERCPLARHCVAHCLGLQADIPAKSAKPRIEPVHEVAVAVWRRGKVLLVQRPTDAARWAGMWELPRCEVTAPVTAESAAGHLLRNLGLRAEIGSELMTVRHGVTRFRITLTCLEARYRAGDFRPGAYVAGTWLTPPEFAGYPLSRPQRRIAQRLSRPRPVALF